jgi:thiol-disulfide isomerase/thioredoxin
MRLFSPIVAVTLIVTAPHAIAQETDAPTAAGVVNKAVAAMQEISAVSYHVRLAASGAIADQAPTIEGDILLEARPGDDIPLAFRGEGTITAPGGEETQRFFSSFDGEKAYGVSYDENTLYTGDIGAGGLDLLTGTLELIIDAFVVEAPFAEERAAFESTLLESAEVDGVACHVVQFQYAETPEAGISRWYFGVDDGLPRRVQRVLAIPAGEATITYEVSSINTSPDMEGSPFMLSAPEGFESKAYDTSGLLPVGSEAPDFTLENDEGESVTLSELRGQVVVLDFWATWCGPCKAAMPGVQELHEEFAEQPVAIYGVNCWEQGPSQAAVDYFRGEKDYTYGLLLGGDAVADTYRVTGIPTFYVIGPDGTIVYRSVGAAGEDALRKIIAETIPAS